MSNGVLVIGPSPPPALAVSVYPVPVLLILRSKNVATPLTAATGLVPLSVPPPGLAPSAKVTSPVKPVATLPRASSARTFTAGLIWRPAIVVLGGVPNTSCVAVPAVIVKELLVVELNPAAVAASRYPLLVLSSVRLAKVATPSTAATTVVPLSVLPPGLFPSVTVTFPAKVGTGFPAASSAVTRTAGPIGLRRAACGGSTVNASCDAALGVM